MYKKRSIQKHNHLKFVEKKIRQIMYTSNLRTSTTFCRHLELFKQIWFLLSLDCAPGFYGDNCKKMCGKCKIGTTCNTTSGLCPNGCKDNLSPPFCTGNLFQHNTYFLFAKVTCCNIKLKQSERKSRHTTKSRVSGPFNFSHTTDRKDNTQGLTTASSSERTFIWPFFTSFSKQWEKQKKTTTI